MSDDAKYGSCEHGRWKKAPCPICGPKSLDKNCLKNAAKELEAATKEFWKWPILGNALAASIFMLTDRGESAIAAAILAHLFLRMREGIKI